MAIYKIPGAECLGFRGHICAIYALLGAKMPPLYIINIGVNSDFVLFCIKYEKKIAECLQV